MINEAMPFTDYLAVPAYSNSFSRAWTPAHSLLPVKITEAMRIGTAVHSLVLNDGPVPVKIPDLSWGSNAGKAQAMDIAAEWTNQFKLKPLAEIKVKQDWLDWCDLNGLLAFDSDTFQKIVTAAKAVMDHPVFQLMDGQNELSFFAELDADGYLIGSPAAGSEALLAKARADHYSRNSNTIFELKTATNGSPWGFRNHGRSLGYHRQAAHYKDMVKCLLGLDEEPDHITIVVEPETAFVACYRWSSQDLDDGFFSTIEYRKKWHECASSDCWPAYPLAVEELPYNRY